MIAIVLLYGIFIERNNVVVHSVLIHDPRLASIFQKSVVVQLTDLHVDALGVREHRVIDILNELKPDLIFLTGDYVQWNGNYTAAIEFLSLLQAKTGMLGVLGDYDYSNTRRSCLFCHEEGTGRRTQKHPVQFLRNNVMRVRLPGGLLTVFGWDGESVGAPWSGGALQPRSMRIASIILSHTPENFDKIDDDQDVFVLAGDTHGGQVPLPSWLFRILGYEKNARYDEGYFQKGRKKMYVSRGIGTSHLPLRIMRAPEVVVLEFRP